MGTASPGWRAACFYGPYAAAPGTCGLPVTDPAALERDILAADAAGLQAIVHAIGDRANDWLLDVYRDARAANGGGAPRRIEHARDNKNPIRRLFCGAATFGHFSSPWF